MLLGRTAPVRDADLTAGGVASVASSGDPMIRVATNLRVRRAELDLTMAEVAARLDVDPSYYTRLEGGVTSPGVRVLTRIARALETTPSELLKGHQTGGRRLSA